MRTYLLAIPAVVFSAGGAMALPTVNQTPGTQLPVEQIHGDHRSCQLGRAGWHYHYHGRRIVCDPRPSGPYWGWRFREGRWGWWHDRERRWWR